MAHRALRRRRLGRRDLGHRGDSALGRNREELITVLERDAA
jgi:hypothetical protein